MNNQFQQVLSTLREQMLSLPLEQYWQVGPETGQYLKELVIDLQPQKILEIGTSSGYSTTWLIDGLNQQPSELISIESNQARFDLSQQFLNQIPLGKTTLTQIRHHAPEVFPSLDLQNLNLVFCDAIKKQTLDLFLYLNKFLTQNSVFVVDNAISHKDRMQDFYDYISQNNITHKIITTGSGLIEVRL